ncbi:MAG: hypothetical protein KY457_11390 [Actinobacteria bacterium]|nr:hypothetical protein [Actinomycetota bacterium]
MGIILDLILGAFSANGRRGFAASLVLLALFGVAVLSLGWLIGLVI